MKPSDLSVGMIDFFSSLLPGAIAAFLIFSYALDPTSFPALSSTGSWSVFLVSAYLLGQVVSALGESVFKRVQERYNGLRRRESPELRKTADHQMRTELRVVAAAAGIEPNALTDTFWWAGSVVRSRTPHAGPEIDGLIARSKLFRALVVVSPLAFLMPMGGLLPKALVVAATAAFSAWRALALRWAATERTFEYYLAGSLDGSDSAADRKGDNPQRFDLLEDHFGLALGADEAAYRERITLYVAHKDREGDDVETVEEWITKAETVLSRVGGGATSDKVRGAWLGDRATPIHEDTTLVYSYAEPESIVRSVAALRRFLVDYGTGANQGEVALSLENPDGSWFFRIPRSEFPDGTDS